MLRNVGIFLRLASPTVVVTAAGRVAKLNDEVARAFGLASHADWVGKHVAEVLSLQITCIFLYVIYVNYKFKTLLLICNIRKHCKLQVFLYVIYVNSLTRNGEITCMQANLYFNSLTCSREL